MTALNANRAFGIELEVIMGRGMSREKIAERVRAAGVSCNAESYGHSIPTAWKVVSDGSLPHNGAEVVSPKLYGESGLAEARRVADALVAARCTVTTQCGFHVHVDASDFEAGDLAKVAVNFLWFETFFDHIMPESRRGSHNRYVNSNRSRFGGYGTTALNAGIERVARAAKGQDSNCSGPVDHATIIQAFCRGDRYHKLNLTAWTRQGSIEFRQHSGTVEAAKIEHWVRLCSAFVDKSKVSKPRPRKVIREWTAAEEMHLFFGVFALPETTRRFYMQRRRDLAAASRKMAALRADPVAYGRRVLAALQARAERIRSYRRPLVNILYQIGNAIVRLTDAIEANRADAIMAQAEYAISNRLIPAITLTA